MIVFEFWVNSHCESSHCEYNVLKISQNLQVNIANFFSNLYNIYLYNTYERLLLSVCRSSQDNFGGILL